MTDAQIDPALLSELKATTGAEFAAELLDTFLEEVPAMLAELRAARAEGSADRFRRAAHSLKSNASTFGAVRLAAMARNFELAGLGTDASQDIAAIAAIEAELSDAAVALKALCDG